MKIDVYTFAIVLGITHSIQFVIFLLEYNFHKNYKGPGWWLLWCSSSILGFFFLLMRQIPSVEHLSIFCQNVMFILAAIFVYVGILRFLERRERLIILITLFLLFIFPFSYYVFIDDNIHARTILLWLTVFLISILSAFDLFLYKPKTDNLAIILMILVFVGHAIFSISKVLLLLTGSQIPEMNSQIWLNVSTYMEILIVTIFWTYALIMMINHRLSSEMERARDHFEIIFNTTPDAVMITDLKEGTVTSVNDKFYDLSGYDPEFVIGKSTIELNFWYDLEERNRFLSLIHQQGYVFDFEAKLLRKDLEMRIGLFSSRVINLNNKIQLISIVRDITTRKKREEEVIRQNNQLQILNSEKDKFFSIIAHDLKSPFSAFLGLTEVMAEEIHKLSIGEVVQLAAKMRDSARNLYGLLDNLLEWSLFKQGLISYHPVLTLLIPEVAECVKTFANASQKKNIEIITQIDAKAMVYADLNMLRSLIRNLLSNAIKFTCEGGSITIAARCLPEHICQISVRDTGIGISQDMQEKLFKIDKDTSRKGTNGELSCGLGLLLCKEFVSSHNGKIWVESEEEKGSCFYAEFPAS